MSSDPSTSSGSGFQDAEQALQATRLRFVAGFAQRVSALRILLDTLGEVDGDASAAAAGCQTAHKLAGIGGMLGFPSVSAEASRLETALAATPVDLPSARAAFEAMSTGFVRDLAGAPPVWVSGGAVTSPSWILVVEDDAEQQHAAAAGLRSAGFQVMTASTGPEAVRLARTESPDLILLDVDLPELNGLAVCQELKLDPQVSSIPVIMVTARGALIDRMAGLAIGADDYVRKPYAPGELLLRIRRLLGKRDGPAGAGGAAEAPAAAAPATGIMPYEDFAIVARQTITRGPACVSLVRTPPALLDEVAERMVNEVRRRDQLGRYSPAHIIVLSPGLPAVTVRTALARIVGGLPAPDRAKVVVGVVETPGGADEAARFDSLVARADLSLAEARVERSGGTERPTVLVAEDDPDVLQIIDARLKSAGYRTLMAFDGEQALDLVAREHPDVLLLDLMMPKLTGFDVLARLRELGPDRPQTVVVSARGREADVTRAFELDADDFLAKPFNPDELVARIARLLR